MVVGLAEDVLLFCYFILLLCFLSLFALEFSFAFFFCSTLTCMICIIASTPSIHPQKGSHSPRKSTKSKHFVPFAFFLFSPPSASPKPICSNKPTKFHQTIQPKQTMPCPFNVLSPPSKSMFNCKYEKQSSCTILRVPSLIST